MNGVKEKNRKLPSVRKNFVLNALLSVSSSLFSLITFPYVSRILLPDGMGRVSFATSFIAYFGMIAKLGIPVYGVRACAKVRDDREELSRVSHELLLINLLTSLLMYLVLWVCMGTIPRVREDWVLFAVVSLTIFLDALGMEWLYAALEQYTYITVRSMICKLIALGATFLMVRHREDVILYGAITIFATSAANILNFLNAHRFISLKPVGNYCFRRHLKAVAVFFGMTCATTIYNNLDTVMLGFMRTDVDVGYYHAAVKVKNVLVHAVTALGGVLLPRLSYYLEKGQTEEFHKTTERALNFVLLTATPLSLFFMLFARESILLLSGEAFQPAEWPMRVMMPCVTLIGITDVLGIQMLIPLQREKTVLYSVIAGAVTDLILNALLIPAYGATGAAVGTLVAETVVLVAQYRALREMVREPFGRIQWIWLGLALLVSAVACLWVKTMGWGQMLTLVVAALCFGSVYGVLILKQRKKFVQELR